MPAGCLRSSCRRRRSACACPTFRAATAIAIEPQESADAAWQELLALVATVEDEELLDPKVGAERLLYRLFNEHGVRVFEGTQVEDRCSCSEQRIRGILEGFTAEEVEESTEDGVIRVACEFCSKAYEFKPSEFAGGTIVRRICASIGCTNGGCDEITDVEGVPRKTPSTPRKLHPSDPRRDPLRCFLDLVDPTMEA